MREEPYDERAPREPLIRASSVIAWARRYAGSVRKLRIRGYFDRVPFKHVSPEDLAALVAAVGPSLTDISVRNHLGGQYQRRFWESLRTSVVPCGRLRSLVVRVFDPDFSKQSRASAEAFAAKLRAKNPRAQVDYY